MPEMVPLKVLMTLSKVMDADPLVKQIEVPLLLRLNPFLIALLMLKRLAHYLGTYLTSLIVMSKIDPSS
jgi:hypothetical protein